MVTDDTKNKIKVGIVIVLLLGISVCSMVVMEDAMFDPETEYEYTVKAEQVQHGDDVTDAQDYGNLTDAERQVLFDAFKESDHFLGGSEESVHTDEPLENVSSEWKVVRVNGVPVLMAIQGPEEVPTPENGGVIFFGTWGIFLIVPAFILFDEHFRNG